MGPDSIAAKAALETFIESLDKWAIFCTFLVVVGVGGEFLIGYLHWTKGKQLHRIEEAENVALQKEVATANSSAANAAADAAKANAAAADANLRIVEANVQIAQANERAEQEKFARLKIEARLADRNLTAAQMQTLHTKLRAITGYKVNAIITPEREPTMLANKLLTVMSQSGWEVAAQSGHDQARVVGGLLIEVKKDAPDDARASARALAEALRAEDLFVGGPIEWQAQAVTGAFSGNSFPDAAIRLTVGAK